MKYLKQLSIILFIFVLGEVIARILKLPIPGNIVGMLIMILLMYFKIIKFQQVEETSNFFILNMVFFFIPPGIGLINTVDILRGSFIKVILIIFISTILVMVSTAFTVDFVVKLQNKKINKSLNQIENINEGVEN